jgi:hypothetical protein
VQNIVLQLSIYPHDYYTGWWFQPTPLKNMSSSVGVTIPNIWKKIFQTTNQYVYNCIYIYGYKVVLE